MVLMWEYFWYVHKILISNFNLKKGISIEMENALNMFVRLRKISSPVLGWHKKSLTPMSQNLGKQNQNYLHV